MEFGTEPAGKPEPPHLEIRAKAPQRIGKGRGPVFLDTEMRDPGEEITCHRHGGEQ